MKKPEPGTAQWHSDRVLKWLHEGGSSWGVPTQSIGYCALRVAGKSHKVAREKAAVL